MSSGQNRSKVSLDRLGVEGSVHRRVLGLLLDLGHDLLAARDVDHPSRLVLHFDPCDRFPYHRIVTIEDVLQADGNRLLHPPIPSGADRETDHPQ